MDTKESAYNQFVQLLTSDLETKLRGEYEKKMSQKQDEIVTLTRLHEEKGEKSGQLSLRDAESHKEEKIQLLEREIEIQKLKIQELEISCQSLKQDNEELSVGFSKYFTSVVLLEQSIRSNLTEFDKYKSNIYSSPLLSKYILDSRFIPTLVKPNSNRQVKKRKTLQDSLIQVCETSSLGTEMVQQYKMENPVFPGKYIKKADLMEWTVRTFKAKFNSKDKTLVSEAELKKHVVSFLGLLQTSNHHGCQTSDVMAKLLSCVLSKVE